MPAGLSCNQALGVPRVTVRRHYDRPPFSGLDAAGRAGRNPRARDPERFARVAEATVLRCEIAASGAPRGERPDRKGRGPRLNSWPRRCAFRRSASPHFRGRKKKEGAPAPTK